MNIKYSFIIPHKNTPDLLMRCVNSIPEREDVQVIVVDDNSDEEKKPTLEKNGVEIILLDAKHSKGAGRARNVGLKHAKGKWLLFADADDYYTDYLPSLLDKYANDETTDIVYLNACKFDEDNVVKSYKTEKLIKKYINGVRGAELDLRYNIWTPWSRMVKHHIVENNKLQYDELPAANDKMFCLLCSYYSRNIKAEMQIVYNYYRPSKGSITDRQKNSLILDDILDVRRRTILLYKKAQYKKIPSYWFLFYKKPYVKGMSRIDIIKKYFSILHVTNTNIFADQIRYLRTRLHL